MRKVVLLFLILTVFVSGSYAYDGAGTIASPFRIGDCNQLQTLESYTRATGDHSGDNEYWEFINNVSCSGFGNFLPIGVDSSNDFHGHLDGNGFTVSNITTSINTLKKGGIISVLTTNASLKNLGIIDSNFWNGNASQPYAALAVGKCQGGLIDNVYVQGGNVAAPGGLYSAGLVGQAITDCNVSNSYVLDTSIISGSTSNVGGFIGKIEGDVNVTNCYSNASVVGSGSDIGAFIGADLGAVCVNNFYDTDTAVEVANTCGTGKTTIEMKQEATFTGWDFTNVWEIEETLTYPFFLGNSPDAVDLNITTINGLSFLTHPLFAFELDGNITIDFNVFNFFNRRLTIDLNFSPSVIQGSGTVIVKDLNLTETYCSDQNFTTVSECSFSWDFSDIADGNYTIIGLLKSESGVEDFNTADGNFQIVSDVNIVVLVPINEETGVVIDTSVSSFIVRINANGILSVFNNQTDVNGFIVPISSDLILVEIDTNTPALFNSRVYSFIFSEPQALETLQPYLPPVAASILTTVKVLEFENLNPIPNVRIKVFKDLATGRTLIHDSVTDGKGETTIPFIVADLYEIDVLVGGVVIFTEFYIATATTNEHFIFISSTGDVVPPDPLTTPTVVFTPAQKHFNTIDINLGVIVSTDLANISAIQFVVSNADFNIYDSGFDSAAPADGNTYTVNINDLNPVLYDTNSPFISTVVVFLTDGNSFAFSASYSIRPGSDEILNILMFDMRTEFECNTDDLSIRCDGLMFLAFFITLFVLCAFAAGARGILGGEGLTLIGLILFGFFTFIAWIPLWLFIVMVFAAMGVILTRTRFIGA